MNAAATKVPAFTASQHVEMLRLGINPATVEAVRFRFVPRLDWHYDEAGRVAAWNPGRFVLPVIARDGYLITVILPCGKHFTEEFSPEHPLRPERVGR
jgi:hypothetical protein